MLSIGRLWAPVSTGSYLGVRYRSEPARQSAGFRTYNRLEPSAYFVPNAEHETPELARGARQQAYSVLQRALLIAAHGHAATDHRADQDRQDEADDGDGPEDQREHRVEQRRPVAV